MFEEVGISSKLSEEQIIDALSLVFAELEFVKYDVAKLERIQSKIHEVMYEVVEVDCDYPMRIQFYFADQENTSKREQYLASRLSSVLNCKTIVPYENPENRNDPFYDLVFDNGRIFLASDCESKFAGGGDEDILIVKELELKIDSNFDEFGNYLTRTTNE